jgi:hypothetical protein
MAREFPGLDASKLFHIGFVKMLVYGQRPQNEVNLQQKITAAFLQIIPEMLSATCCKLVCAV